MKLSTRARYGLRICFLMGLTEETLSLTALTKQTNLSEKYLEQILRMLKKAGIVYSRRGISGGYGLSRTPAEITVQELLVALNDAFDIADCTTGACTDEYCPNRKLIARLYSEITKTLSQTTLQDMIDEYKCVK